MSYRVDTIPLWLKPFYLLYSYLMGAFLYGLACIMHATCRIRFVGLDNLSTHPNHIFSMWHTHLGPYFAVFVKKDISQVCINHPLWFMKPIHVLLTLMGMQKIIFGSSGHSGKAASEQLVEYLKKGYSTTINPDGPAGPPKVLKKGVLHLALASSVPVIPMRIKTGPYIPLKTWDHKKIPLPFTTLTVIYEKPVWVTQENFEKAGIELVQAMGVQL